MNGAHTAPEYEPTSRATDSEPSSAQGAAVIGFEAGSDAGTRTKACMEGSTDGGALDVWVRREGKAIFIVVPMLGLHERWLDLDVPMRCDGDPRRATPRLTTVCSAQETSFALDLTVEDGALLAGSTTREYGGRRTDPAMRPVRLPCGARLVFHGLTFRDPKWKRFGSPCLSACLDRSEACTKPCVARFTNTEDELTDEGAACMQSCTEAEATCMERCPPG